jgi:hypothetical protein
VSERATANHITILAAVRHCLECFGARQEERTKDMSSLGVWRLGEDMLCSSAYCIGGPQGENSGCNFASRISVELSAC